MAKQIADVDRAREAARKESWAEAYEEFRAVDPAELSAGDQEGFADAAWGVSRLDESLALRGRAYAAYAAVTACPRTTRGRWLPISSPGSARGAIHTG